MSGGEQEIAVVQALRHVQDVRVSEGTLQD